MTEDYYPYIKDFFKKYSGVYNIVALPLVRVRKKVVIMARVALRQAQGERAEVLDIATGTGKQAFAFAKSGYKVIGIDFSEDMLKIAIRNNKYRNLKLEVGDATNLPYENNRFDATCVSFAIHDMHPAIWAKVAEEMVRVTKPGGVVVVADYALPKNRIVRYLAYRFIRSFESKYYPEFIKNNLHALLEKAGIRIEEERGILFGAGRIIRGVKAI